MMPLGTVRHLSGDGSHVNCVSIDENMAELRVSHPSLEVVELRGLLNQQAVSTVSVQVETPVAERVNMTFCSVHENFIVDNFDVETIFDSEGIGEETLSFSNNNHIVLELYKIRHHRLNFYSNEVSRPFIVRVLTSSKGHHPIEKVVVDNNLLSISHLDHDTFLRVSGINSTVESIIGEFNVAVFCQIHLVTHVDDGAIQQNVVLEDDILVASEGRIVRGEVHDAAENLISRNKNGRRKNLVDVLVGVMDVQILTEVIESDYFSVHPVIYLDIACVFRTERRNCLVHEGGVDDGKKRRMNRPGRRHTRHHHRSTVIPSDLEVATRIVELASETHTMFHRGIQEFEVENGAL